jgi:hypothetical protein
MSQSPKPRYFAGLDLGQANDFTVLAVLEQTLVGDPDDEERQVRHYAVRHLERFALGTPYGAVRDRVAGLFREPPLSGQTLVVDQTGVGKPVLDLFRRAGMNVRLRRVTVSAGHHAALDEGGGWLVPRKELVSTMQVLLQSQRLKVAESLPEAPLLVRELVNFKAKVTAADKDDMEAWREGTHDDLVLAVAIAAWEGERYVPFRMFIPIVRGGLAGARGLVKGPGGSQPHPIVSVPSARLCLDGRASGPIFRATGQVGVAARRSRGRREGRTRRAAPPSGRAG